MLNEEIQTPTAAWNNEVVDPASAALQEAASSTLPCSQASF